MTVKQSENQIREFSQQFNEQIRALEVKSSMDNSILTNIHDIYKKRAAIEQEYSDQLFRLSASISQKCKNEESRRPRWKNYSLQDVLTRVLVSTQHTARGHKNLAEMYGKQMTQRIIDMQEDHTRLTRKSVDMVQKHHTVVSKSLQNLIVKHRQYMRASSDLDDAKKKASRALKQLDDEVRRCQGKQKEIDKNTKIKRNTEEYFEKKKVLDEKESEFTIARNKYLIQVDSLNATLKHFFGASLNTIQQCQDFSLHNNLTRLCMNHASCENAMQGMHETVHVIFDKLAEQIDALSDSEVFKNVFSDALFLKEQIQFIPVKDDQVSTVLKNGEKVDKTLNEMNTSIEKEFNESKAQVDELNKKIDELYNQLMDLINQSDYDVSDFFSSSHSNSVSDASGNTSKTNSLSRVTGTVGSNGNAGSLVNNDQSSNQLYTTIQKKVKEKRLGLETEYIKNMDEYLMTELKVVNYGAKIKQVQSACYANESSPGSCGNGFDSNSIDWSLSSTLVGNGGNKLEEDIQLQTALLIGKRTKLFGGDLKKYSEEMFELVPVVVKSCIQIIARHGMQNVGIFRIPGSQNDVVSFREKFDRGLNPLDDLKGTNNDVNLAASILKCYFRELDPPIFDKSLFKKCLDNYESVKNDENKMVDFLHNVMCNAHTAVYATTKYLLAFLNHVMEFSQQNCMDVMNLAIIFGPCLIPVPEDSANQQFQYQGIINQLTECLINNHTKIFDKPLPPGCQKYEYSKIEVSSPNKSEQSFGGYASNDELNESPSISGSGKLKRNESARVFPPKQMAESSNYHRSISESDSADQLDLEAVAIAEYCPKAEDELKLSSGTQLVLTRKLDDDWWYGYNRNEPKRKGRIPAKYVREKQTILKRPKSDEKDPKELERKKSLVSIDSFKTEEDDFSLLRSSDELSPVQIRTRIPSSSPSEQLPPPTTTTTTHQQDDDLQQVLGAISKLDQINIRKNRSTLHVDSSILTRSKFVSPIMSSAPKNSTFKQNIAQTSIPPQHAILDNLIHNRKNSDIDTTSLKDYRTGGLQQTTQATFSSLQPSQSEFVLRKPGDSSKISAQPGGRSQFEMASSNSGGSTPSNNGNTLPRNGTPPPTLPKPHKKSSKY